MTNTTTADVVGELRDAINAHDPDRVAACFTDDYRCERPLHPAESFTGSRQVRRNYAQMFAAFAEIEATILRSAEHDREHWSEWEMRAISATGDRVLRRGPVILTTRDGLIDWARFYVDPVDDSTERVAFTTPRIQKGTARTRQKHPFMSKVRLRNNRHRQQHRQTQAIWTAKAILRWTYHQTRAHSWIGIQPAMAH